MQHVVMPEVLIAERRRLGLDRRDEMWHGVLHINLPGNTNHPRIGGKLARCLAPLAETFGLELLAAAGRFDPAVKENKSFWVPEHGWHQLAALPAALRGGDGGLEVRIRDHVEVV
jgi:hypothetical protein